MKLLKQYGLFIFWGILILDTFFCTVNDHSSRYVTKLLLLPTLAAYLYANTKRSRHWRSKSFIYTALGISFLSDIFILLNDEISEYSKQYFKGDNYLQIGMILIIVSCAIYGYMFRRMYKINFKDWQEAFIAAVGVIAVSLMFLKFLKGISIGSFSYILIMGVVVFTGTLMHAANLLKDKTRRNMGIQFFIPGVSIIILSVGILVAARFLLQEARFLTAVIVLTYSFGQMLVVRGFTKYLKV